MLAGSTFRHRSPGYVIKEFRVSLSYPWAAAVLGLLLLLPSAAAARSPRTPYDDPVVARPSSARAQLIAPTPSIVRRWAADDADIASGAASRTWTWGPQVFRSGGEEYAEAPAATRNVWYLDKARMEITHPESDPSSEWYVTSGLLVRELISGKLQTGDRGYTDREPAAVPVAGDLDAPIDTAITYVDLQPLASLDSDNRAPSRVEYDPVVTEVIGKGGIVTQDERLLQYNVHLRAYDDVLGHNIAHVFTDALPADRLLYLAGRPLTEPYWTTVSLGGAPTDVLIQAFERRVLTYTPSNPAAWQVEWGNVGRQYAQWRYGVAEDGAPQDPGVAADPPQTTRSLEELSPPAAQTAANRGGVVGVAVLDLRDGTTYSYEGARAFPMYSTAKVPIMLAVLNKAQREGRPIAGWEDDLLRVMIQNSDNNAATTLISYAGGAAAVTRYLRSIGIEDTMMNNEAWGYSTTTARDMARLMAKLGDCTLLNADLCRYALGLMREVTPGQRWGIGAGVPESAAVAIKNGWSPDDGGWAINSIGYVSGPQRYAIAIYTRRNPSKQYGIDTIEAIARDVYRALP